MRIGIDCSLVPGEKVGVGQYTYNLVHALAKLDKSFQYILYPVFYYIFNRNYKKCALIHQANFKTRFRTIPAVLLKYLWDREPLFFSKEFLLGNVDLVHSTTYCAPVFKNRKKKLVATVYDVSFLTNPECHLAANIEHCMDGTRRIIERADAIIAISNHTKEDLIAHCDAAEEKIHVTHLAAGSAFREVDDEAELEKIREKYRLPPVFILFVGSLEPRKNVKTLLKAYSILKGSLKKDFPLVLAGGQGWLNSEIASFIKDTSLADRVHFTGYVEQADLPAVYSAATVFVYPSLYEGFGLPILEAMACGVPVITSRVSSMPEVAGDAAILVNPTDEAELADALKKVVEDRDLQQSLRVKGIRRAKAFSWERCAEQTLRVYRSVIA